MTRNLIVVLDNGTGYVKCGFSKANFPASVFPSIVGRPILRRGKNSLVKQEVSLQEITFGNEALKAKDSMELSHPMDNGVIRDWDDMELLWDYTFKKVLCLGSDNGEKVGKGLKILLTEPPLNPKANRAKMVKIMFERFGFDAVYVGVQAVMTLYAQGISTGVVVDSGDGVTHIVPVYDGYTMPHITKRLDIAGRDITRQLSKLLFARGYSLGTSSDFESIREIKEKHCYIATEREKEVKLGLETTFLMEEVTLEDGRIVKFGSERFDAPEILFSPHLMGRESGGLSELLFETIQKTDVDLRPELFKNIVLSGGSTMYPGFSTRLENDIKELHLTRVLGGDRSRQNVRIADPPKRKHMVFLGGAVLADLMKDNDGFWLSKDEWKDLMDLDGRF